MAVHRNHAANIVAKTNRWVDALDQAGALDTPAVLIVLEASSEVGELLAGDAWDRLAEMVEAYTGRPEVAPVTTRKAIRDACAARKARPVEPDPFAGLPSF